MNLKYRSLQVQGECILKQVKLIKENTFKFILFVILCIFTLGIPQLLIFWYPDLKRFFYFDYVSDQTKATHFWIRNYDDQVDIQEKKRLKIYETEDRSFETIGFKNRYMTYYLDSSKTIRAILYDVDSKISSVIDQQKTNSYKGLSFKTASRLTQCYGVGTMVLQKPSLFRLFVYEVLRPMFLFILFSIIVWLMTQYYYYVGFIIISAIVSLAINLYQTHKLNTKIHGMAYYVTQLNVLREGKVVRISSLEAVPGDIVFLNNSQQNQNFKLPFDGKVIEGSLLINQCSLTGESVPVVKKACTNLQNLSTDKNCLVFEGTTLIQANSSQRFKHFQSYRQSYGVPICVHKTNFYTSKGSLIRIIRFPKEQQNIFQRESSKFLIFIFFFTVVSYSVMAFMLSEVITLKELIITLLDLVTISVPPSLPISMTIGIIYAVEKLQNKHIYCTSQNNIIKGGSVSHVCFDKTGTLTQNYMDFYGVLPFYHGQFQNLIKNLDQKNDLNLISQQKNFSNIKPILYNFGANHSLIENLKNKQIIGDPMQLKVFEFGDFHFDYSQKKNTDTLFSFKNHHQIEGDVFKVFQFDSDVQRMSVLCRTKDNQTFIFCKGSPEMLKTLFDPSSFDIKTYDNQLRKFSSKGFRILAIGSKRIGNDCNKPRQELERGIKFEGFTIFENMLKPESHPAILQLKEADINCSMITGDSSLTACCMGLECEIADREKGILIFDKSQSSLKYQEFNSNQKEVQVNLPVSETERQKLVVSIANKYLNHQICLTGNIFAALFQGNDKMEYSEELKSLFMRTVIFARAKPNQKAKVISIYQYFGKIMGMCGDGANDCGALKQAEIGLSLSQTQASISAPFTSKVFNIQPMVQLIKQCRAALATNFSLFNIMTMYSLIQFSTAMICQYYYCYPNDLKFVYWDVAGNFVLLLTYGNIGTADKLTREKPSNSLFSFSNLCQLFSMLFLQFIGQLVCIHMVLGMFTQKIDFYSNGGRDFNIAYFKANQTFAKDSSETAVLFVFTNFLYIASFVGFSIQKPWRKRFYTSWPFLLTFLVVAIYSSLIFFVPQARFSFWKLDQLSDYQSNLALFCLSGIFSWLLYSNQKYILEPLTNWAKRQTFAKHYF